MDASQADPLATLKCSGTPSAFLGARCLAAFSLGTFFVAVDKESTSPVGANTHYPQSYEL